MSLKGYSACLWYVAPNHPHLMLTHTWFFSPVYDLDMGAGGGNFLRLGRQVAVQSPGHLRQ